MNAEQLAAAEFLYRALNNMPCACSFESYGGKVVKACQRCKALAQLEFGESTERRSEMKQLLAIVLCLMCAMALADEAAVGVEVAINADAKPIDGQPLTAVAVTQCSLLVAVYVTMPDGRLLRFDRTSEMEATQLLAMAYSAVRSERIEISCDGAHIEGYERREPT